MGNRFTFQDISAPGRPPTEKRVARPLLFHGQWFALDGYLAMVDAAEAIAASVLPDEPPIAAELASPAAGESIERIELEGGPILERGEWTEQPPLSVPPRSSRPGWTAGYTAAAHDRRFAADGCNA